MSLLDSAMEHNMQTAERARMIERLKEQEHLLNKAVGDFYAGDTISALSIAVIVRVLVHETGSSTPLLKYLTDNYQALEIKNKAPDEADALEANARRRYLTTFCPLGFSIGPGGLSNYADLSSPMYELVPLKSWWNRTCLIFPYGPVSDFGNVSHGIFSKKQLTLILANKEGGAHVDVELPEEYVALVTTSPVTAFVNGAPDNTVNLARSMVAQTGVELLDCVRRNFAGLE